MENKLEFTPISMKCTQEQFDEIRPILESGGCEIDKIYIFDVSGYLVNNYNGKKNIINNIIKSSIHDYNRTYYPEWNKEIFLNACGIEMPKEKPQTMTITTSKEVEVNPDDIVVKNESETKESNPLDNLPIIGEGVLMEVSDDEKMWFKRFVCAKYGKYFLAHEGAETIDKINYMSNPHSWKKARPITPKTKINRAEFERLYEIID